MQINQVMSTIKKNKATSILVVFQVALTFMILSYAALNTLVNLELWNQPTGLAEDRLISVRQKVFDSRMDVAQLIVNDQQMLNSIEGVSDSILVSEVPLDSQRDNVYVIYLETGEDAKQHYIERFDTAAPLLEMIDAQIVEGRNFNAAEKITGDESQVTEQPAVTMISQALAEALFPEQSAIGKTLYQDTNGKDPLRIIGVYSNFLAGEVLDNYHTIIRPLGTYHIDKQMNYLLQTSADVTPELIETITNRLYETKGRYVSTVEALARPKKRMYDGRGSHSFTLLGISVMAMFITALGIGGLITFTVNQRKKTIGIRRALGGTKKQIVNFFLLEISVLTVTGFVLGSLLLMLLSYKMADLTGNQFDLRWGYLLLFMAMIWIVSLLASWFPAKRAANIEPAIVTRGV